MSALGQNASMKLYPSHHPHSPWARWGGQQRSAMSAVMRRNTVLLVASIGLIMAALGLLISTASAFPDPHGGMALWRRGPLSGRYFKRDVGQAEAVIQHVTATIDDRNDSTVPGSTSTWSATTSSTSLTPFTTTTHSSLSADTTTTSGSPSSNTTTPGSITPSPPTQSATDHVPITVPPNGSTLSTISSGSTTSGNQFITIDPRGGGSPTVTIVTNNEPTPGATSGGNNTALAVIIVPSLLLAGALVVVGGVWIIRRHVNSSRMSL